MKVNCHFLKDNCVYVVILKKKNILFSLPLLIVFVLCDLIITVFYIVLC